MISLLIPANLRLRFVPGLLVLEGPFGVTRLATGKLRFRLRDSSAGRRLVVDEPGSDASSATPASTLLAHVQRYIEGVTRGIRRRLRLVGVGFRASTVTSPSTKEQTLNLKLGYREERQVALAPLIAKGIKLTAARLEGRSKATLINVEGTDLEQVHQVSANLRKLRVPDSYKGKGIQYDQEKLSLKKGKRE